VDTPPPRTNLDLGFRFSHAPRNDPSPERILEVDWEDAYGDSAKWTDWWETVHQPQGDWPPKVKIYRGKMYYEEKLCVPEKLANRVLKAYHTQTGHVGTDRLCKEAQLRFIFPESFDLRGVAKKIRQSCDICQAADPPNWQVKGPIVMNPVPPKLWSSVSLDVFAMPDSVWDDKHFDCFILCVDRLSGWMLARPASNAGLTGEVAAHLIIDGGWGELGIPTQITSDRGSEFISQFWLTLCARLGVNVAFSQAHRPQANGRAEVAGKSLIAVLRKLDLEDNVNWVEALPRALRIIHDRVGEGGLSPHQIMFGRDRNLAGLPYDPIRVCEDADESFYSGWRRLTAKLPLN